MEANQSQSAAGEGLPSTAAKDGARTNLLSSILERIRSGEFKARLHYFMFRQTQQALASDSLWSKYKRRLREDWPLWVGLGTGLTGLMMLFSAERFWFWQLPLILLLVLLAPAFFEIPAALNSLIGHTEHQHLVGKIVTLSGPIVDGHGKIQLEGREWLVSGPNCDVGKEVRIVTLDSKTLYVTPVVQRKQGALR